MYVSGWLSRGPNGVIATTMYDAFQTAELIVSDLAASTASSPSRSSKKEALPPLPDLRDTPYGSQKVVGWRDWKAIDEKERENGKKLGKEREKFVTIEGMLGVLG